MCCNDIETLCTTKPEPGKLYHSKNPAARGKGGGVFLVVACKKITKDWCNPDQPGWGPDLLEGVEYIAVHILTGEDLWWTYYVTSTWEQLYEKVWRK